MSIQTNITNEQVDLYFSDLIRKVDQRFVTGVTGNISAAKQRAQWKDTYHEIGQILSVLSRSADGAIAKTEPLSVLNSLPDGVYEAKTDGLYPFGLTAKEGYYTRFKKTGTVWTLYSEIKSATLDGIIALGNSAGITGGVVFDYLKANTISQFDQNYSTNVGYNLNSFVYLGSKIYRSKKSQNKDPLTNTESWAEFSSGGMTNSGSGQDNVIEHIYYNGVELTPDLQKAVYINPDELSGAATTSNIVSDYNIGGVDVGEVIPAGTNIQALGEFMLKGTFTPDLIAPTFNLSSNAGTTREIGESVQITLTATFNRGDIKGALVNGVWNNSASQGPRAGVSTSYEFNGVNNGNTASRTITHVVVAGANSFSAKVNFAASTVQPKNNKDTNYDVPLPAGNLSKSIIIPGAYKSFFGASSGLTAARSLPQNAWANTNSFDLTATMGFNYYDIYVISTKELVSVIDVELGNVDITTAYVNKGLFTINDAGGTGVSYRKYQLYNAQPYNDKHHTHKITLKDI